MSAGGRSIHRRLLGGIVACAILALPSGAAGFTPEEEARIDRVARAEMEASGYPGLIVGAWSRDDGRYLKAFGVSDTTTGTPLEVTDQLRVGSLTKTFTATVVLRLVEQGKLRLDDPVSDYYDWVPQGRRITIRQLLGHTSGLADLPPGVAERIVATPQRRYRPVDVAKRGAKQAPICQPGECWSYSNTGYILLGLIAQKVTGEDMEHLYRTEAFRPVGLEHTSYSPDPPPIGIVHGYLEESPGAPFVDTTEWDFNWASTAGAMVSTASDLHRWVRAIATGSRLLSPRMQKRRLTYSTKFTGQLPFQYGLGIGKWGTYLGHNGIVFGYEAMAQHSRSEHASIVIMGNTSAGLDQLDPATPDPDLFGLSYALRRIIAG